MVWIVCNRNQYIGNRKMVVDKMKMEGWSFDYTIIGRNKVGIAYGTAHYMKRDGVRFWNRYPPDDGKSREGYYYNYKSLCGRVQSVHSIYSTPNYFNTIVPKAKPCLKCLILLAKKRHII